MCLVIDATVASVLLLLLLLNDVAAELVKSSSTTLVSSTAAFEPSRADVVDVGCGMVCMLLLEEEEEEGGTLIVARRALATLCSTRVPAEQPIEEAKGTCSEEECIATASPVFEASLRTFVPTVVVVEVVPAPPPERGLSTK